VAVVVRRAGTQFDRDALLAHLEGRCARYRWPHHVFFWGSLPKSGYGKIVKKDIRQQLFERGDLSVLAAGETPC
jgi:acyl-CoA synthetase (AMP-forming)/AMP-acid ligase II